MQLLLSAVLALLAVGPAVCWPMDDNTDTDQARPGGYPSMEQFEGPKLQSEVEESYPSDVADTNEQPYDNEQGNSQSSYDSYYTAVAQSE